jgi:hypothetical protein
VILTPSRAVRVFAFPAPADLRNGYNGLFGLVQNALEADPMVDLDREQDIEELRRIAHAQQAQIRILLDAIAPARAAAEASRR